MLHWFLWIQLAHVFDIYVTFDFPMRHRLGPGADIQW